MWLLCGAFGAMAAQERREMEMLREFPYLPIVSFSTMYVTCANGACIVAALHGASKLPVSRQWRVGMTETLKEEVYFTFIVTEECTNLPICHRSM